MVILRSKICLSTMIALFYLGPISHALEMSPKKDCAICHVMWLDEFRSDKETLIEWQPGNVLMKNTQGVVSSEEICYSCHDGYVNDSRNKVWKYNRHSMFVKPSKNVEIPDSLTLSNKDEIYCGTCHSPHGTEASPVNNSSSVTSFFRVKNVDSSLCEMCHTDEADFRRSKGHPLHTAETKIPETLFGLGSKKASENRNSVICQTCHQVHGAKGSNITVIDNKKSELCILCHKERIIEGTKHDLRLTLPEAKNIKEQPLSESGPCGACHTPHNAAGYRLWARKPGSGNPADWMCLSCHGKDTVNDTKRIGDYSHPVNIVPASKDETSDLLPLYSEDLKESASGHIQCFTCHNVHQWNPDSPDKRGGKDIEGDASNSFLRISNSSSSALCVECHLDKKQLIDSDHNLIITAPEEKNIQGFTANISGPCGACHIPHNATGARMWARQLSTDRAFTPQVCTECHEKNGIAKEKSIGDNDHPVNVYFDKSHNAAFKKIENILPLYEDNGERHPDGKIACMTCHEPHSWDPARTEPDPAYSFRNVEGNNTNSFLRIVNSPSSDLCEICHEESALVYGTDHDLNVTAPNATNLSGQTVKESGQCGSCHLAHGSPNKLLIWGRSFGQISNNENIMNALCTSCHSEGGIAENKVPPIATHPRGELVTNIMRINQDGKDYTHIFDKDGKEVNVGDISCPSCHSFARWSPLHREKGPGKNVEGDAMNSFLRTVSYDAVCVDCHGSEALHRYSYFHDPDKRQSGQ